MDFHDFWEKEKKWLLGVVAGALLFWIALGVVRSTFDVSGTNAQINGAKSRIASNEDGLYGRDDRREAEDLAAALRERNAELRAALEFEPSPRFLLDGKGPADTYLLQVGRDLRRDLTDRAENTNVSLDPDGLRWPTAVEPAEIAEVLLGLNLLEVVGNRLLDAGERVRLTEPENLGLIEIEQLAVRGDRSSGGRPSPYGRRRSRRGSDAGIDSVRSVEIDVRFLADSATVWAFLEACRAEEPHVVVRDFQMKAGDRAGEPETVTVRFAALVFDEN
jgi:hypothetical protein